MEALLPKLLGEYGCQHTWKLHPFKGRGKISKTIKTKANPQSRDLLSNLPSLLSAYAKNPGIDAVVVVLDTDKDNCTELLSDIKTLVNTVNATNKTLIRLAIEEMEAWYFGDRAALLKAWPKAKINVLNQYKQDSVCGTWERLADAIYKDGSAALIRKKKAGEINPGELKCKWAEQIGPLLNPDNNISPSFIKFRDGVRKIVA